MWYDIDFQKLCRQFLPPVLRSKHITALINVMIVPLVAIYTQFRSLKALTDNRLNITGHVFPLETAMNTACDTTDIYIESTLEDLGVALWWQREGVEPTYFVKESEGQEGVIMTFSAEKEQDKNFVVYVPTDRCTSLESQKLDEFDWYYLTKIKNILDSYKPAGRTYRIELYDK